MEHRQQSALTWAMIAVGPILAHGFRDFDSSGFSNSLAGFLLEFLLVAVGLLAGLMGGQHLFTVDPSHRRVIVEDTRRSGREVQVIPFDDIGGARVAQTGNRTEGSVTSLVNFRLRNCNNYPLFHPAYYDERRDRSIAEERCSRLETSLGP